jgi:hypothetical protein
LPRYIASADFSPSHQNGNHEPNDKNNKERSKGETAKSNEASARAEASFRKEERAKEGAKAMMQYQASNRTGS